MKFIAQEAWGKTARGAAEMSNKVSISHGLLGLWLYSLYAFPCLTFEGAGVRRNSLI